MNSQIKREIGAKYCAFEMQCRSPQYEKFADRFINSLSIFLFLVFLACAVFSCSLGYDVFKDYAGGCAKFLLTVSFINSVGLKFSRDFYHTITMMIEGGILIWLIATIPCKGREDFLLLLMDASSVFGIVSVFLNYISLPVPEFWRPYN